MEIAGWDVWREVETTAKRLEIVLLQNGFISDDVPLRCVMKMRAEALKHFQCGWIITIKPLPLEDVRHSR